MCGGLLLETGEGVVDGERLVEIARVREARLGNFLLFGSAFRRGVNPTGPTKSELRWNRRR